MPDDDRDMIDSFGKWFAIVGMAKEWDIIKEQFPDDPKRQLMWARIIEMNRISAVTKRDDMSAAGERGA